MYPRLAVAEVDGSPCNILPPRPDLFGFLRIDTARDVRISTNCSLALYHLPGMPLLAMTDLVGRSMEVEQDTGITSAATT
jgi:hypothetical protein